MGWRVELRKNVPKPTCENQNMAYLFLNQNAQFWFIPLGGFVCQRSEVNRVGTHFFCLFTAENLASLITTTSEYSTPIRTPRNRQQQEVD